MEYLSKDEKLRIEQFCKNKPMFEAVKKVFLRPIYHQGTLKPGQNADVEGNFLLQLLKNSKNKKDSQLASDLRGAATAVSAIDEAFEDLKKISTEKPDETPQKTNKAI